MGEQFSYLGYYSKYTTHYGIETITEQNIEYQPKLPLNESASKDESKPKLPLNESASKDGSKNIVWITFNSTSSKRDDEMYEENLASLMGILNEIEIKDEADDKEISMAASFVGALVKFGRLTPSAVYMLIKETVKQFPKLMIQSAAIWALVSFLPRRRGGLVTSVSLLKITGIKGAATSGPLLIKLTGKFMASFTGS